MVKNCKNGENGGKWWKWWKIVKTLKAAQIAKSDLPFCMSAVTVVGVTPATLQKAGARGTFLKTRSEYGVRRAIPQANY